MAREKLQRLIATLQEELGSSQSIDEESRKALQQLIADVDEIASGDTPPSDDRASAAGQLEKVTLQFESEHPKLSMILGEIIDTLGKLGI
ncbi:MAG: DUF4404 family protein [Gammaproteobacteria bacterium]|nr:DUF4404 family protein [Gammaproteobacteria bacterium]